ncbi:TIGR04222 domain-containing membrane protein [Streptomyces sp. NPDC048603]|uniref:TIGR04222 domain-containing membrane protein n=1 Tax=Streptomyces sp. NPDC048603 TaxID=3365577 RepID=UPI0037148644
MFWVLFLLVAWAGVLISCTRLVRSATEAAEPHTGAVTVRHHEELTLYEAAYLAGGPHRVVELTLVAMERERRLLLAHTGWATVVVPAGRDALERAVLAAFGPDGQSPVADVRTAAAGAEAVGRLAERLAEAGLALTEDVRSGVDDGVRAVWGATVLVLAMCGAALAVPDGGTPTGLVVCWFALPLVLALACLAMAAFDGRRNSGWASPAGQRLLTGLDLGGRGFLAAVAVRGVSAVPDPGLRAALSCDDRALIPRQRGH